MELIMITEMFKTKQEIKEFLIEYSDVNTEYTIHDDLTVEFFNGGLCFSGIQPSDRIPQIIPFKCINIKSITYSGISIENFEGLNLPEGLREITVFDSPLKSTKGIPSTVEKLVIHNTKIEYLEDIPKYCEVHII
jgi:hypothetical protein